MTIRTILLTGDDGYNSLGTRLLIHALKDTYDLQIAGTLRQQSGVGSKISIHTGFEWGSAMVDDVPALWVDATPADAIELATAYFDTPFDLVISGVNWGANLGTAIPSSGTLGAAQRCLAVQLASKALAFSWDVPVEFYTMDHNGTDSLEKYLEYPGKHLLPLLQKAVEHEWWSADLLNVNFPAQPTSEVKMTNLLPNLKDIFEYETNRVSSDLTHGHFEYKGGRKVAATPFSTESDVGAVNAGLIAVTPCKYDYLDHDAYDSCKEVSFSL